MKKDELNIPFKLVKIEDNQFSSFEETLDIKADVVQKVGFGFGADLNNRVIGVSIQFQLEIENKPLLKQVVTCYFEIENKSFAELTQKNNQVVIPCELGKHMAMLTTGTARGILFANTKNTEFNKLFLGLINLEKIFKNDITIEV